ncbi:MAG: 3-hydroxyacyl-ACP dehydratase FabZ [Parvularculaceae bacterium]
MSEQNAEFDDLNITQIMAILPHRYPMLLVDKIIDMSLEGGATGIKNVTMNEPFFQGHFPGKPVMPGVMIIEAMAQTAAAYTAHVENLDTEGKVVLFMGVEKAKFRRPVVPGDQLHIHIRVAQKRAPVWRYEAKARVDGKVVTEAHFSAMLASKV